MNRLKLYLIIGGIALLVMAGKGCYDKVSCESKPFAMSLNEIEKNGVGDHKFVKITGALPAGNFVYSYSSRLGIKGDVKYLIYPVISIDRITQYAINLIDTATGEVKERKDKLRAKVIVKMDTTFPVSRINSFSLDTNPVTIVGMVRSDLGTEDKNLLKDDALELEPNFVYIVKEEPQSYGLSIVMFLGGFLCLGIGIAGFASKK
jgi:hypothetical protein